VSNILDFIGLKVKRKKCFIDLMNNNKKENKMTKKTPVATFCITGALEKIQIKLKEQNLLEQK